MTLNPNELVSVSGLNMLDNETHFKMTLTPDDVVKVRYKNGMIVEMYLDENGNKKILYPKFISYRESEDMNFEDTNYSKSLDLTYIKKEI